MTDTADQFTPSPGDVTEEGTQGEVLVGVAVHAGLEQVVIGYMQAVGHVLYTLAEAAERLAEDGLSLIDFAGLLRGGNVE